MNVVFILWLRQLKLYSRSRARMIGALGQPTLFPLHRSAKMPETSSNAGVLAGFHVSFLIDINPSVSAGFDTTRHH
jgi:hypothetical protein